MAIMERAIQTDTTVDHRRLRGLVSLLSRQEDHRIEAIDFSHPLLAGSTMAEISLALAELKKRGQDDLCDQFAHWMKDADTMAIGTDAGTPWQPLTKLRYSKFNHRSQITNIAYLVWSAADCWLVHVYNQSPQFWFSIQSIVSKQPAAYFKQHGITGPAQRVVSKHERLPPRRAIHAAITHELGRLIDTQSVAPVTADDADLPLITHIIQNFKS